MLIQELARKESLKSELNILSATQKVWVARLDRIYSLLHKKIPSPKARDDLIGLLRFSPHTYIGTTICICFGVLKRCSSVFC